MRRHLNIGLLKGLYFRFGAAHMDVIFFFTEGQEIKNIKAVLDGGKESEQIGLTFVK